ncbi:hypothetical protein [Desnuesiella massiliensis]|uniref:hypothetical protein n=1 Tax=Desnuesiella massiliensis TaxID=1650662 RepID=UPI0006E30677|nr:hypothetical protein [Desnuesiella massiliensis]
MIILDNLGEFRKGRLWINTFPNFQCTTIKTIKTIVESNNCNKINIYNITLELLLMPRHTSNYGLLGAKFTPTNKGLLEIQVDVSQYNGDITKDSIAMPEDEVHVGIPEEYAHSIMQTSISVIKEIGGLPSGILQFNLGAHGYVGSSILIFSKITSAILKLMTKKVDVDLIREIKEQAAIEINLI